jgi:hypothetical protein
MHKFQESLIVKIVVSKIDIFLLSSHHSFRLPEPTLFLEYMSMTGGYADAVGIH